MYQVRFLGTYTHKAYMHFHKRYFIHVLIHFMRAKSSAANLKQATFGNWILTWMSIALQLMHSVHHTNITKLPHLQQRASNLHIMIYVIF